MAYKLLLADDSVTIQRVIELTFADEHIQVIAVGDGQQAIARIESERPDVVLADVGMPEKDGYEVASFVKNHEHLKHIPVLLLTGAFEPVDEARAHAIGCDGVLVKPFEPQMVINRVKDLLAGRRPQALWATPPGQPPKPAGAPAPQPAARPDHKQLAVPAAEPQAASTDSLDDYFDRLDAAFASLGTETTPAAAEPPPVPPAPEPQAPPASPAEPAFDRFEQAKASARDDEFSATLDRWDPSLSDEAPAAPAPASPGSWLQDPRPTVPAARSEPPPAPVAPPEPARAVAAPSLSDAFAALLAAEQSHDVAPVRPPAPAPPAPAPAARAEASAAPPIAITEDLIETIVRRVVERLTATAVQDQVLQVAERLVREEIARIKGAAN
jgi:CheY-like chemotaxis protein